MKAHELAKRVIDRLENPQDVPAIIWWVVPASDPPMIDDKPDDLLEGVTQDGKIVCYIWGSYGDAI
jgi:hypothetical protein